MEIGSTFMSHKSHGRYKPAKRKQISRYATFWTRRPRFAPFRRERKIPRARRKSAVHNFSSLEGMKETNFSMRARFTAALRDPHSRDFCRYVIVVQKLGIVKRPVNDIIPSIHHKYSSPGNVQTRQLEDAKTTSRRHNRHNRGRFAQTCVGFHETRVRAFVLLVHR